MALFVKISTLSTFRSSNTTKSKMEFSLKSGSPYRQGTLLFKNKVIETPAFISYTRNGLL